MMKFLDQVVDKVQDKVGDWVGKYIDDLKPQLRAAIEAGVQKFREDVLNQVPETVSRELKESPDSKVGGLIAKAIAGKVEDLLEGLLHYFSPHVDAATASVTDTVTDESIDSIKGFVTPKEEGQPQEAGSREVNLPGVGKVDFSQTIGNLFNVQEQLPKLEAELREHFAPVGDSLKTTLWDRLVEALNTELNELMPWLELPTNPDAPAPGQQDRGWLSDKWGDLKEKMGDVADDVRDGLKGHIPELYEAIKGKVDDILAALVKALEDLSVSAAMGSVDQVVKKFDLIKPS